VTTLVSAKQVQQDSDEDGWTDLEEERMGLDPHSIDSDGDHLNDGQDGCPDYAPRPEDGDDENLKVLQKAIFATFGLSGSRNLLFVGEKSRRIQVWGYEGPILFKMRRNDWIHHHAAGIWVDWSVISRHENDAEVSIRDYEGPLASGGQSVTLRNISGEWYVIKWVAGPVS
jgi:hypothetical protein